MSERTYAAQRPGNQGSSTGTPGVSHTARSWETPNGSRFSFEATSYTNPGLDFGSDAFGPFASPTRSRTSPAGGGGFAGGALGLLNSMMFGQGQREDRVKSPQGRRDRAVYIEEPEETDSDEYESESEEELAYGPAEQSPSRPRSVLEKFKDKLRDGGKGSSGSAKQQSRSAGPARDNSQSYKAQRRGTDAGSAFVESTSSDEYSDESDVSSSSEDAEPSLQYLEDAVEHEQRAHERVKRRYQRALGGVADPASISARLKDLKAQERVLEMAERDLRKARLRQKSVRPTSQSHTPASRGDSSRPANLADDFMARFGAPPVQPRPRSPPERRRSAFVSTSFNANFGFGSFGNFDPFAQHRAFDRAFTQADPIADLHSRLEEDFLSSFTSGNTRPQTTPRRPNARSTSWAQAPPRTQPQPRASAPRPRTYPSVGSAALFETYNTRWLALPANSPAIPFPTPRLTAQSLSNALTVPHTTATSWSQERVLQANAQLFFLQALQLTPVFSEDDGVVSVTGGEDAKRKLLEVLKKERVRWHSDRLGRRNGGGESVNEALQADERCRAVFHGVCGLAEALGARA